MQTALHSLGHSIRDVAAIVLTHAHFDHMGFARRARESGIPLHAHHSEVSVAGHPWRYHHEHSRIPYLRHPAFIKILSEMTALGALGVRGTSVTHVFSAGEQLDVPGRPQIIACPGHSFGHCALLFPDRGVLLAGDAFVTLDPYTGRRGPCIVAGAATADSDMALQSLGRLAELDVAVTGVGHGPVWRGSLREAETSARKLGPS
jgi:glyoxylase-like metal-dependent hydrolase (beta-lactamase superfamily II)